MMPGPGDFVERNGKSYPNLSKNRNRQKPTVLQTKITSWDEVYDTAYGG